MASAENEEIITFFTDILFNFTMYYLCVINLIILYIFITQ
jgi:hypothetical protein